MNNDLGKDQSCKGVEDKEEFVRVCNGVSEARVDGGPRGPEGVDGGEAVPVEELRQDVDRGRGLNCLFEENGRTNRRCPI